MCVCKKTRVLERESGVLERQRDSWRVAVCDAWRREGGQVVSGER